MIFDWHNSKIGHNAQSVGIIHEERHYLLTASPTLRDGEFQAMCNGVRVTKDLFSSISEAKTACEKWFKREVLGEVWEAKTALRSAIFAKLMELDPCEKGSHLETVHGGLADALVGHILANFKVEPL